MFKIIGLTGNIAVGKSTVLEMLRSLGAQTIDADKVVHQIMEPGWPAYEQIVEEFGPEVLGPDEHIDRKALAAIVFPNPTALARLEEILHVRAMQEVQRWLSELRQESAADQARNSHHRQVAVVDAVKLVEAGWDALCDAVWIVTASEEQQYQRMVVNRNMKPEEARARLAAQPSLEEKLGKAAVVIDNSGTVENTRSQVLYYWDQLFA
ncbi:MAG: dephospho-CoA kinase [Chloroflexota bacterium]|nr:MAG: dephospho-CoA kinase [Chloroflexota bacterium]